jgi:hypothetical protein
MDYEIIENLSWCLIGSYQRNMIVFVYRRRTVREFILTGGKVNGFISHVNSLPVLSEKLKLRSKAKCLLKRIATPFDSLDPHNHALAPPPCVFHSLSHRLI